MEFFVKKHLEFIHSVEGYYISLMILSWYSFQVLQTQISSQGDA